MVKLEELMKFLNHKGYGMRGGFVTEHSVYLYSRKYIPDDVQLMMERCLRKEVFVSNEYRHWLRVKKRFPGFVCWNKNTKSFHTPLLVNQ